VAVPLRVLSIDGGGIRGIIPAKVLADLELRAGRPVAKLFDLVVGTSTGGILALGLTAPGEGDSPRWAAADLADLYVREGPRIFHRSVYDRIRSVDGGVFAANPAMCALAEVLRVREPHDVMLVSLGTGQQTRPLPWKKVRNWGALEWARPIIDILLDGQSDTVDFQARQVLEGSYWRIQTELRRASDHLDNASEENLRALQEEGDALVASEADTLAMLAEALKA